MLSSLSSFHMAQFMTTKLKLQQQPWISHKDNHLGAHACYKKGYLEQSCEEEVKYNQQCISQLYVSEIQHENKYFHIKFKK